MSKKYSRPHPAVQQAAQAAIAEINSKAQEAARIIESERRQVVSRDMALRSIESLVESGDAQLFDLIQRLANSEILAGSVLGGNGEYSSAARMGDIRTSRYYCATNPLVEDAIKIWRSYGFGSRVTLATKDENPAAQRVIDEFWDAPRNDYVLGDDSIGDLSDAHLADGEQLFILWTWKLDGRSTIEVIAAGEFNIIYDQEDKKKPVWYTQTVNGGIVAYPDYRAFSEKNPLEDGDLIERNPLKGGVVRADTVKPKRDGQGVINGLETANAGWTCRAIYKAFKKLDRRGQPAFKNAFNYAKQVPSFIGDRMALSRKNAMYATKITVDGGANEVAGIVNRLSSTLVNSENYIDRNPATVGGGDFVRNKAIDLEKLPLSTGASDGYQDFVLLLSACAIFLGVPIEFWLPQELATKATVDKTLARFWQQMNSYNLFWSSMFKIIAHLVLALYKACVPTAAPYESFEVDVSLDTPLDSDPDFIVAAINAINSCVAQGTMGEDEGAALVGELVILLADAVGANEAQSILDDLKAKQGEAARAAGSAAAQAANRARANAQTVGQPVPPAGAVPPQVQPQQPAQDSQPAPAVDKVQDTALNGAQIASLIDVIAQVQAGVLPVESATAIIQAAFPTMGMEQIMAIIGPIAAKVKQGLPQGTPQAQPTPPANAPSAAIAAAQERFKAKEITAQEYAEFMAGEVELLLAD